MEEDAGEEETEEELAPIMVQLAYVAAQLGKHAEAVESYEVSFPACPAGTREFCQVLEA